MSEKKIKILNFATWQLLMRLMPQLLSPPPS